MQEVTNEWGVGYWIQNETSARSSSCPLSSDAGEYSWQQHTLSGQYEQ